MVAARPAFPSTAREAAQRMAARGRIRAGRILAGGLTSCGNTNAVPRWKRRSLLTVDTILILALTPREIFSYILHWFGYDHYGRSSFFLSFRWIFRVSSL